MAVDTVVVIAGAAGCTKQAERDGNRNLKREGSLGASGSGRGQERCRYRVVGKKDELRRVFGRSVDGRINQMGGN